MELARGTLLGPYRIGDSVGAGAMGTVYRATDTGLGREVALKVLNVTNARDADRLARFEREARILAALNHPNIAHLYGQEQADGVHALAMELVDGPTLAERIASGPLPLGEALDIAAQIARAVEAAHLVGVIHRDLKPANIKLRPDGTVKVLDFGIGKVLEPAAHTADDPAATSVGAVLGTAAYMSPEQARGKPVDARTDVWSFGCIVYEMLTGQPVFAGADSTSTLARVLEREPALAELPADTPRAVTNTIRLCLEKDASRRLRDIGDAQLALEGAFESEAGTGARPAPARALPWLAAASGLVIGALAVWVLRPAESAGDAVPMRFDVVVEAADALGPTTAISPDGARIVHRVIRPDGTTQLATRRLSDSAAAFLDGTEGGYNPFFSPDGDWIGFFASGRLMKVQVQGGVPVPLADAAIGRYGSWSDDGYIYAELNPFLGLARIAEEGGAAEILTHPEHHRHAWPQALPGNRLLYTAGLAGLLDNGRIEVMSLESGQTTTVLEGGYMARYVASSDGSGRLLYIRNGLLYAVPFDLDRLEVTGTPQQLADDIASTGNMLSNAYDVSDTGTLVYSNGRFAQEWTVDWMDRTGESPLLESPGAYYTPRLAPDGRRLAYAMDTGRGQDIYVHELERGIGTRLTVGTAANLWPVWTPDGEHVIYTSLTDSVSALWYVRADSTGMPQLLLERENPIRQIALSPDGTQLIFTEQDAETGSDLWAVGLDLGAPEGQRAGEPRPLVRTPHNEGAPAFAPNGRWFAYLNDELGPYEAWVEPFPAQGSRWQVTDGGGGYPFWSTEAESLFLASGNGRILRIDYNVENERFIPGVPVLWRSFDPVTVPTGFETLDLAPDGQRFAVLQPGALGTDHTGSVTFVVNLLDELERQAPAR